MLSKMKRALTAVGIVALGACTQASETMLIKGATPLLAKPFPIGYPSTEPLPNSTVANLQPGEQVKVLSVEDGKDFRAYRVVTKSGEEGFVISGGDFEITKSQ